MTTWRPAATDAAAADPRPVAVSLDVVTRRFGLARPDVLGALFGRWEALVGPDVAAHARPVVLRDGVLRVEVDQPAWATQLRFLQEQLLGRLRAEAGDAVTELAINVVAPAGGARRRPGSRGGSRDPLW